ncbi:fibronectin type III domain-containing protein [Candidatus Parcubacteria bacterium]|nr:fibronectin type III domain-containing protein [Candidatus Parcubacteria bacterium]
MQNAKKQNLTFKQARQAMLVLILLGLFIVGAGAKAAMKSSSYIIYENIHHTFDGPIISSVSHSVDGVDATVVWNTNIVSDAYVIYSTDSSFAGSMEQGSSVKNNASHSVTLTGLTPETVYYYQVRSERINGGATTDTTPRSFTSGSTDESTTPPSGGGGLLIIDKTDKAPPEITNVQTISVTNQTAVIVWETDEEATSFIEYGLSKDYGSTYGEWASSTKHSVALINLEPDSIYHLRAISSDGWGNVGYSGDIVITTIPGEGEEALPEEPVGEEEPGIIENLASNALDFISRLFPEVSLNELSDIGSIDDLSGYIATPILIGEPMVEIGASEVTISWSTDIESNSLIALAPEQAYNPETPEPYQQIVGSPGVYTFSHEVTLHGLTPDTTYHFQLRSAARLGPTAHSRDFSFRTSIEELQIVSYLTQIIDNETAVFKWVTNKPANSAVTFTPYFNNVLGVDQQKTVKDNADTVVHEITINEFVGGTYYEVEMLSTDDRGNEARKILSRFSTTEDDLPPVISHIKADSTIFVDRSNKIQTIISWLTNEPSTSQVEYQEGVHGGNAKLSELTNLNMNYTKEHVMVVTKFKPGVVYSFRVKSVDSGDNLSSSKVHTFMTAKKKESIITIIMNILENTFGWLKKLM